MNLDNPTDVKRFPWKTFMAVGIGVPLVFVALGAYFIYQAYVQNTTWDNTAATVTRSEVVETYDSSASSGLMYAPIVEYTYSLNDRSYRGSLGNWGSTSLRSSVDKLVNRYPIGASITVKVNPADPSESALPGEISIVWYILLIAGLVFMVIFVSVGLVFRKKQKALLASEQRSTGYTVH